MIWLGGLEVLGFYTNSLPSFLRFYIYLNKESYYSHTIFEMHAASVELRFWLTDPEVDLGLGLWLGFIHRKVPGWFCSSPLH